MLKKKLHNSLHAGRKAASFFVPLPVVSVENTGASQMNRTAILIPTYKPNPITYKLIKDVVTFYPKMQIVVIDDNTPLSDKPSAKVLANIRALQKETRKLTLLRTPHNHLKASALNFGLEHLTNQKIKPAIIITVDDDVVINKDTFTHLISALETNKHIGAVCSMARVKNKKKNLLTRLQSLEYHSFNITKISDNGFLHGPLVMPGMLTAFRFTVIKDIKGFSSDKLLEDYDITVRVKKAGYRTAIITKAVAWTYAPESLQALAKQRIRWSYGGLIVVKDFYRSGSAIFQDLIGHVLFVSLFTLVILSFIFSEGDTSPAMLIAALIGVALLHFIFAFLFNVITLKTYPERDKKDWMIKLSLFPEFAYSNLLSGILIGAYLFLIFNLVSQAVVKRLPILFALQKIGLKGFSKFGYSSAWGTRS